MEQNGRLGDARWATVATRLVRFGRDGGIRTHDPLTPSQVRYQAALHPDAIQLVGNRDGRSRAVGYARRRFGATFFRVLDADRAAERFTGFWRDAAALRFGALCFVRARAG